MKLNKIFISGMAMLSLTACDDFLDVDPDSTSANTEFIYNNEGEISTALNGVYAQILSGNTFGNNLYKDFQLNSDVDFSTNTSETASGNKPARFDTRSDASNINSLWNALYKGVETANEFIFNLKNSKLYEEKMKTEIADGEDNGGVVTEEVPNVTKLTQMMGEAKVMRAMFYHELLSYWGDIPFTFKATYETNNLYPEVTDRQVVSDSLIADLRHAAEWMQSDKDATLDAPERISKEAAYAMIARLALQAGGYSLNHDANDVNGYKMTRPSNYKEYYQIARDYAKKVIDAGGHSLNKSFRDVFVDECNHIATKGDDAIFEIPFGKDYSGAWGYAQGPKSEVDANNETDFSNQAWGSTSGNVRTTRFYRHMFKEGDARRDYVCGTWGYSNQGLPAINFSYTMYNNKWSKLWNTVGLGKASTGNTGINFAYIRYADVLLMFAEADNEVNGAPTQEAIDAVNQVRRRAYNGVNYELTSAQTATKEDFLKAVLDERKFEFAGENMRWKDLVRNNLYSEQIFYTFLAYYGVAEDQSTGSPYIDMLSEHDGIDYANISAMTNIYYVYVKNTGDANFPNSNLYMLYIVNPWTADVQPSSKPEDYFANLGLPYEPVSARAITGQTSSAKDVAWGNSENIWSSQDGVLKNEVLYSLFGYIRGDEDGSIKIVNNGAVVNFDIDTQNPEATVQQLPAVRYLLPYPQEAIARSDGRYKNYYGF